MPRVYVRLQPDEADALVRLAQSERRHPSDQAGLLLSEVLKRTEVNQEEKQPVEAAR
jgi:hypothetical protein